MIKAQVVEAAKADKGFVRFGKRLTDLPLSSSNDTLIRHRVIKTMRLILAE